MMMTPINNSKLIKYYIVDNYNNTYETLPMNNKERHRMKARGYIVRDYQNRYEYICKWEDKFYGLEIDVNDEDHDELMELIDNE